MQVPCSSKLNLPKVTHLLPYLPASVRLYCHVMLQMGSCSTEGKPVLLDELLMSAIYMKPCSLKILCYSPAHLVPCCKALLHAAHPTQL
jgi:hypothetical protein